ncbi:MAG: transporter substrate-binding domain-containing protein [Pseudomonadota bacterium]
MKIGTIVASLSVAVMAGLGAAQAAGLKTGVDGTFAPHAMPKLGGGVEGFNIDYVEELRKRLGVEIELDATQWSGLLPGLQAGTYDFIAAPTTLTEERAENLLFIEGYLNTDFQFMTQKGAEDITTLEQFKGKTIAVNKGSAYDKWTRDLAEEIGWTVESYGTQLDAVQAVISGRAFANVAGNTGVAWAVQKNPQLQLSYLHSTGKVFSTPVRKDNVELRAQLENAVECMKLDGTFAAMHEKWFGIPAPEGSAAVTVYPGTGMPGFPGYDPTERTPDCG